MGNNPVVEEVGATNDGRRIGQIVIPWEETEQGGVKIFSGSTALNTILGKLIEEYLKPQIKIEITNALFFDPGAKVSGMVVITTGNRCCHVAFAASGKGVWSPDLVSLYSGQDLVPEDVLRKAVVAKVLRLEDDMRPVITFNQCPKDLFIGGATFDTATYGPITIGWMADTEPGHVCLLRQVLLSDRAEFPPHCGIDAEYLKRQVAWYLNRQRVEVEKVLPTAEVAYGTFGRLNWHARRAPGNWKVEYLPLPDEERNVLIPVTIAAIEEKEKENV